MLRSCREPLGTHQTVGIQPASGEGGIRTLERVPTRSTIGMVSIAKAQLMNRAQWRAFLKLKAVRAFAAHGNRAGLPSEGGRHG